MSSAALLGTLVDSATAVADGAGPWEALADPDHPDNEERLAWLGLDNPAELDPAAFDQEEVNRALAKLR